MNLLSPRQPHPRPLSRVTKGTAVEFLQKPVRPKADSAKFGFSPMDSYGPSPIVLICSDHEWVVQIHSIAMYKASPNGRLSMDFVALGEFPH